MIIKPRIRNFICTTAHPVGCAQQVSEQCALAENAGDFGHYNHVLVIGCSTGYGLASRISAMVNYGANTLGVMFEKAPAETKTGTAGWYNNLAFEQLAQQRGLKATTLNGDAFSTSLKHELIEKAKEEFGPFDLVIYSLAAPKRKSEESGEIWSSVLKPVSQDFEGITLDTDTMKLKPIKIEKATEGEIEATIKVMGGEDWASWMQHLHDAHLLAPGCRTLAYNYIGRELTWPIYGKATIGKAKEHLLETAEQISHRLAPLGGKAQVAVLKAVVTQSSSAIPIMPLYISLLFRVMKEQGVHEMPMEQILRLFRDRLGESAFSGTPPGNEVSGMLRVDEQELSDAVQDEVARRWAMISDDNLCELADTEGYRQAFLRLFGFGCEGVDYEQDIDPITGMAVQAEV